MNSASDHQPFLFSPAATTASVDTAAPDGSPTDALVQVTVREIAEIVREVATAARSDRSTDEFFAFLVDRVLRAMAAEGVVLWRSSDTGDATAFYAVRSIGRLTESSIPDDGAESHQRLLHEVSAQGQPVVVPPTPGATDPDVPANPTEVPAAVLAIEIDPTAARSKYLLEIFLDPESGVATQRGYLRFAAQMVDLAGEFMRADQLRQIRRSREIISNVDQAVACLHEGHPSSDRLEAKIVDLAVDVFQFDQVGLCYLDGGRSELAAVSHVNQIDRRSPPAKRLIKAAELELDEGGTAVFTLGEQSDGLSNGMVAGRDEGVRLRLIGMTKTEARTNDEEFLRQFTRFALHADLALSQTNRLEAIPGGRLFASLAPSMSGRGAKRWTRPIVTTVALTLLLVVVLFPLPLIVSAAATVRPADVQTLSIPRDAIVRQIHVDHGQVVEPGDPLVTLVDPELEREISKLVGRRAVLAQQKNRWTNALVETPSSQTEQNQQLLGQRSLVIEEIASLDRQLELLSQIQTALVIRADRAGIVDGWRAQERLTGRPLRRGDHLLAVVAADSQWIVETQVAQNRIGRIHDASTSGTLGADVILSAHPEDRLRATLTKMGPSFAASDDSIATTAALLTLDRNTFHPAPNEQFNAISGSPAEVVFDCGSAPVCYLLFQDLIRKIRGSIGLYFGSGNQIAGEE